MNVRRFEVILPAAVLRSRPAVAWLLALFLSQAAIGGEKQEQKAAKEAVHHTVPTRKLAYLDMQYRQLMLDEYVIARRAGDLRQVYPQAKLVDAPLLECEEPHELESMSLNMPSTIYDREAGLYRMWWYNIWHGSRERDGYNLFGALCYAQSRDGLNWHKPELGQLDYKGHGKSNNAIAGIGNSQWVTSVVQGHDGRFRCFFTPTDGTAVLKDGIQAVEKRPLDWHPITNLPECRAVTGSMVSDLLHVAYDPVTERYLATLRTFAPLAGSKHQAKWRRAVALHTSRDGIAWQATGRLVETDLVYDQFVEQLPHRERSDLPAWSELHDMPVQRYEGLLLGLNGLLFFYDEDIARQKEITGTETAYFLTWSRDGLNWSRPAERRPLLNLPHGTDAWGRHTMGAPFMVVQERELWLYHDVGRGHTNRTYKTPRPKQIRMSKLRRDGFAGYRAGEQGGWIQTAPFAADGTLRINADATAGKIAIEVLEVQEDSQFYGPRTWKPLSRFGKDDCQSLSGDLFGTAVQWEGARWSELAGKVVALRIHLQDATVYSFWTRAENAPVPVVNHAGGSIDPQR